MRPRPRALLAGLGVALIWCVATAGPSFAADNDAKITHLEVSGDQLRVLVSVPAGTKVDLDAVTATVGGTTTDAVAEPAEDSDAVRRTAILAIDTSDSMHGERFDAARAAALQFLDLVPDDVYVGVVAFSGDVSEPLAPSLDRDAARAVIAGLELSNGTHLYDGVTAALVQAGDDGQRSLLVLSDGADTTKSDIAAVTDKIEKSDVLLDVVSLDGDKSAAAALRSLASAGSGQVVSADAEALSAAFSAEADTLARQVLVRVDVPTDDTKTEATVALSIPTDKSTLTATAYGTVRGDTEQDVASPLAAGAALSTGLPSWAMYAGVAALGIGLLLLLVMLVPAGAAPPGVVERVEHYTSPRSHRSAASQGSTEVAGPGPRGGRSDALPQQLARGPDRAPTRGRRDRPAPTGVAADPRGDRRRRHPPGPADHRRQPRDRPDLPRARCVRAVALPRPAPHAPAQGLQRDASPTRSS